MKKLILFGLLLFSVGIFAQEEISYTVDSTKTISLDFEVQPNGDYLYTIFHVDTEGRSHTIRYVLTPEQKDEVILDKAEALKERADNLKTKINDIKADIQYNRDRLDLLKSRRAAILKKRQDLLDSR